MKKNTDLLRGSFGYKLLGAGLAVTASFMMARQGQKLGPSPEEAAAERFLNPGHNVVAVAESAAKGPLKVYEGYEDSIYAMWDDEIRKYVKDWNRKYEKYRGLPNWELLDPEDFKCLCLWECRGDNTWAFMHNPAQFGNDENRALGLIVMRDGGEFGIPENGYKELYGYKPIPPKYEEVETGDGKTEMVFAGWDFEAENIIPPELALKYAIGWVWHKNCIVGNVLTEEGPIETYIIKSGDTLSELENELGTTIQTINKHTRPKIEDLDDIMPGLKISYRGAHEGMEIVGFWGWKTAFKKYNGDRNGDYLEGIQEIMENPKALSMAEIALQMYEKHKHLPYVWGGESPLSPEETMKDSFFEGMNVTRAQPAGSWRKGQPTVPGFDCSGFVCYVGKKAGKRPFTDMRASADGYMKHKSGKRIWDGPYSPEMQGMMEPGDLLFLLGKGGKATHVALYLGDSKLVESCGKERPDYQGVKPENWSAWRKYAEPKKHGKTDWDRGGPQLSQLPKYSSKNLSVIRF